MTINLSLNKSIDLKQSFSFFFLGLTGLALCSFYWLAQYNGITDRWSSVSIVLVHLFTIGFLMPVFLGAMSQLLPVLFGIEYDYQTIYKKIGLSGAAALALFALNFHSGALEKNYLLVGILAFFWFRLGSFIRFVLKSCWNIYQQQKKMMHLLLCLALVNLSIALFFSFWLILVHFGIPLPLFRPLITDAHFSFMVIGFFFHLLLAVGNNVIPMFFVTSPIPDQKLKTVLMITPLLMINLIFAENFPSLYLAAKLIISLIAGFLLAMLFRQLRTRKRKNRDPVVFLWCLFIVNALITLLIWNSNADEMILGKMLFLGCFLPLILSMLVRIIPFLIWNKLSQQQLALMNFKITLPHMKSFMPDRYVWAMGLMCMLCQGLALTNVHQVAALVLTALTLTLSFVMINALMMSQNTSIMLNDT